MQNNALYTIFICHFRYRFVDGFISYATDFYWAPSEPRNERTTNCADFPFQNGVDDTACSSLRYPICETVIRIKYFQAITVVLVARVNSVATTRCEK